MPIVDAKCTNCGATLQVDNTKEAMVCQYCGSAFIVEKAITNYNTTVVNNFSGATINVSKANITLNNTANLDNLYQTARRYKKDCNYEEAAKYYDMILKDDPSSWEAYFYCSYYKAMPKLKSDIENSAQSIVICLNTIFEMIDKREKDKSSKARAINEVADKCISLAEMLHNGLLQTDGVNVPLTEIQSHLKSVAVIDLYIATIGYMVGDNIDQTFPDLSAETSNVVLRAWKQGVEFHSDCIKFLPNRDEGYNIINGYVDKIRNIEPNYNPPLQEKASGGCYIATCVYGSYDCPEVWTLRRYRDYNLDRTWYGRAFIRMYYCISPKLVKHLGNKDWFKNFWKRYLDRMIYNLKEKGYEDTRYTDKY